MEKVSLFSLQEGEYFKKYDTVEILLITKDAESKGYDTNVDIERNYKARQRILYYLYTTLSCKRAI